MITLLIGYLVILLAIIAYLLRRSYKSQNGFLSKFNNNQNNYNQVNDESNFPTTTTYHQHYQNTKSTNSDVGDGFRAPLYRQKMGHVTLKQPEGPVPYSYEVVKAQQSSGGDETRFFTELSRTHMQQYKQYNSTLWAIPSPGSEEQQNSIQERRKAPQVKTNKIGPWSNGY